MVTTLAGNAQRHGSTDGTGANARFTFPYCITADAAGVLYVTDNSTIRRITPDGTVTTMVGAAGARGSVDGPAADARFNNPTVLSGLVGRSIA